MIREILLASTILISATAHADCWLVANLHGRAAMSGDNYNFIDDGVSGNIFQISIKGKTASVFDVRSGYSPEMEYTPVSGNTIVGIYQSGGGITVETWSITSDKKVIYSKVMNTPGIQMMTSTKAFVGEVVGNCKK